ncbi:Uncharacterised protein [Peptoniphilus harei]|uniref:Uncharacterized protein n=1 Tax=Peptoniphilus harei TaxID=54005 RepID=A0A2X1Z7Q1_9FIRM|nr:2-phospho-L-lactate transferase CofD family protein [Peptoniphilus harei]SPY39495.1 Uncharacterised protein [Peptoniphilus harei]
MIYIANAMTQKGETKDYSLKDHFEAILKHSNYEFIDEVIANDLRATEEIYQNYYNKDESRPSLPQKKTEILQRMQGFL